MKALCLGYKKCRTILLIRNRLNIRVAGNRADLFSFEFFIPQKIREYCLEQIFSSNLQHSNTENRFNIGQKYEAKMKISIERFKKGLRNYERGQSLSYRSKFHSFISEWINTYGRNFWHISDFAHKFVHNQFIVSFANRN